MSNEGSDEEHYEDEIVHNDSQWERETQRNKLKKSFKNIKLGNFIFGDDKMIIINSILKIPQIEYINHVMLIAALMVIYEEKKDKKDEDTIIEEVVNNLIDYFKNDQLKKDNISTDLLRYVEKIKLCISED